NLISASRRPRTARKPSRSSSQSSHPFMSRDRGRLAKRPEGRAELLAEELGLLPGCEMAALVHLVEVDEVGIRAPSPALWRAIHIVGEDRDADRNGDL